MILSKRGVVWLFTAGMLTGLLSPAGWAEQSVDTQRLIADHRQAAADAQKRSAFHQEMERAFVAGRGNTKIDMVGHCRYWADYYRNLAAREEQAAKQLEQKGP